MCIRDRFRLILNERVSREIVPTQELLQRCLADETQEGSLDPVSRQRLQALADFFGITSEWYAQVSKWPQPTVVRFLRLGNRILKLLRLRP